MLVGGHHLGGERRAALPVGARKHPAKPALAQQLAQRVVLLKSIGVDLPPSVRKASRRKKKAPNEEATPTPTNGEDPTLTVE